MRRLLWKEWREKRWWCVPLALYPVACVLTHHAYTFLGMAGASPTQQVAISGLIALLMGLSGYAPELGGGTADFIYAKPVGWKSVLGAKLGVALAFIIVSCILVAIAFRIVCPEAYLPFATVPLLAQGAGIAALVMLGGYLVGLCCSVALPGMLGSILTFVPAVALLAAAGTVFGVLWQPSETTDMGVYLIYTNRIPMIAAVAGVGLIAAAVATVRFGLTLSLGVRVRRYAAIFVAILVLGSTGVYVWARSARPSPPPVPIWSFSPSGKYAFRTGNYGPEGDRPHVIRIYRLSDGANAEFSAPGGYFWNDGWTRSDKVFALYHWPWEKPGSVILRDLWLDPDGKLQKREMRFPDAASASVLSSPSGEMALVQWTTWTPALGYGKHPGLSHRVIVDLGSFRRLHVEFPPDGDYFEWVSEGVLTYHAGDQKTQKRMRMRL